MQSVSSVRRNLLLINAVLTALLLWLTSLFWYDAYVQKKDAVLLHRNVSTSELQRRIVSALADERGLYSAALSASNAAHPAILEKLHQDQQSSNIQFDTLLDQVRAEYATPELVSRYHYTSFSLSEWGARIDKSLRRLNVYRQYSISQLPLPGESRDKEMRRLLFDGFSKVIGLIEELKAGTSFIPRHNEMLTIDLQDLMSSIWHLGEATRQETVLITAMTAEGGQPDADLFFRLRTLQDDENQMRDVMQRYVLRDDVDKNIVESINSVRRIYDKEYFEARSLVLAYAGKPDGRSISHYTWVRISAELSAAIDKLGAVVSSGLQSIASRGLAEGNRRLLINTAVVIVCLLIVLASLGLTRKVRHIAYHDSLTDLPNRYHFESVLAEGIKPASTAAAGEGSKRCALLMINLDRFKSINDTFGHGIGDAILKETANHIRQLCGPQDMPARVGGDEFAILIRDVQSFEHPVQVAQALSNSIEADIDVKGARVKVGLSVGVAVYPEDGDSATALAKNANIAMYHAKLGNDGKVCRFNSTMATGYQKRVQTEHDLQKALVDNQFELYYQPQVKIDTHRVECVEALLRWHHPLRGMVSPAEFIPIAEHAGLLVPLGAWILDEACRQIAQWEQEGLNGLRIAVNISPQQFSQENFYESVMGALERHNVEHHHLELEVTESIVMNDVGRVAALLQKFRESSIKVAVDDFGTGYSSLQYLQDLPLDILKIDKAFVDGLGTGDPSKSVANSIVQLSKSFDLDTIAEGVETAEQLADLDTLGVQYIQGYYFSKPLPVSDVVRVISEIEALPVQQGKAA